MALLICGVMGWSIDYVLQLTLPQFEYITLNLNRVQYWRARNEVFFGVAAALGDKEDKKNLFDSAGNPFGDVEEKPELTYTKEDLDAAMAKLDKIIEQQRAAEQEKSNV